MSSDKRNSVKYLSLELDLVLNYKSKKEGKDQELVQSSNTPDPG